MVNHYDEKQIAFEIDGYWARRPDVVGRKTVEGAFLAAKVELIYAIERRLQLVRDLEFERWKMLTELNIEE